MAGEKTFMDRRALIIECAAQVKREPPVNLPRLTGDH
jgi:hypothetical protein